MSCVGSAPTFSDISSWTLSHDGSGCENTATIHVDAPCGSSLYTIKLTRTQNAVDTDVYSATIPDGPLSAYQFQYIDTPPCGRGTITYHWTILCDGAVQSTSYTKSADQGGPPTLSPDTMAHDGGTCENTLQLRVIMPCGECGGTVKLYRTQGSEPTMTAGEVIYSNTVPDGPSDTTYNYAETPPCIRGTYYYRWQVVLPAGTYNGGLHQADSGGPAVITFHDAQVDADCNITARMQLSKPCGECAGTWKLFRKLNSASSFDASEEIASGEVPAGPLIGFTVTHTEHPGNGHWYYAWRVYNDTGGIDDEFSSDLATTECIPFYTPTPISLPEDAFEKQIVLVQVTGTPGGGLVYTDRKIMNLAEQRLEWWYHKNGGCAGFRLLTHELLDDEFFDDTLDESWEIHVRIKLGGEDTYTTWYRGVIRSIKHQEQGVDEYADIHGYGYVEMLNNIQVQRIYRAGLTVKQVVDDIIAQDVRPYTRIVRPNDLDPTNGDSGVVASNYILKSDVHFECSALRAIKFLAEIQGNREYGVDAQRRFYFRLNSSTVGANFFLAKDVVDRVAGGKSFGQTNSLKVAGKSFGARDFLKIREDVTDVTSFGRRETPVEVPWVTGDGDASAWADNIIAVNKTKQDWAVITKKTVTSRLENSHPLPRVTVYGGDVSNDVKTYDIAKIQYIEGGTRAPQEIREKGVPKQQMDTDQPLKAMYYLGRYPNDLIDELKERVYDQIDALKGRHKQFRYPNDITNELINISGKIPGEIKFYHKVPDVTNIDVTNSPTDLSDPTNPRGVLVAWIGGQWVQLSPRRIFHTLSGVRGQFIGEIVSLITDTTNFQIGAIYWWTGASWSPVGSGSGAGNIMEGARVQKTSNTTISPGGTTLSYDFVIANDNAVFSSGTPTLLTAKTTGYYNISADVLWGKGLNGTYREIRIKLTSGVNVKIVAKDRKDDFVHNVKRTNHVETTLLMLAGDYIELIADTDALDGGNVVEYSEEVSPVFSMALVSGGGITSSSIGTPSGPAGGDLAGSYPDPICNSNIARTSQIIDVTAPLFERDGHNTLAYDLYFDITNFRGSGANAKRGVVPSPGTPARIGRFLCEDVTNPWQYPTAIPIGFFGDGSDGDLDISGSGDTTLSSGDSFKNYRNVNLGANTLYVHADDFAAMICISGTLTSNGGRIALLHRNGTAGGNGLFGGGNGGAGGGDSGILVVRAKYRAGAITLFAAGAAGGNGTNASARSGNGGGGSGLPGVISQARVKGYAITVVSAKIHAVSPATNGGDGGVGMTAAQKRVFKDVASWLLGESGFPTFASSDRSIYWTETVSAASGDGGGGDLAGKDGMPGAGGGGWFVNGGRGGHAGVVGTGGNDAQGGPGGGGGSGGVVVFVSLSDGSGVTIDVRGGNGGSAGNASGGGCGGSGGGGGGSGGRSYSITRGVTVPTHMVTGGTPGAPGLPAGDGGAAAAAIAGTDGIASSLLMNE